MQGVKIDRAEMHRYLWERTDRTGKIKIYQRDLAKRFKVTQATMSHIITALQEEQRIKKVGARQGNIGIYSVRDPKEYADPAPYPKIGQLP